mgnify:CR=1 FL=1
MKGTKMDATRLQELLKNAIHLIEKIEEDELTKVVKDRNKWFNNLIDITPEELKELGCDQPLNNGKED